MSWHTRLEGRRSISLPSRGAFSIQIRLKFGSGGKTDAVRLAGVSRSDIRHMLLAVHRPRLGTVPVEAWKRGRLPTRPNMNAGRIVWVDCPSHWRSQNPGNRLTGLGWVMSQKAIVKRENHRWIFHWLRKDIMTNLAAALVLTVIGRMRMIYTPKSTGHT